MKKRTNNGNAADGSGTSKRTYNRRNNSNRRQQTRGPQVGQIVNLADVGEGGLVPVDQKRYQPKRTTTGTEEILGTIDIDYNVEPRSFGSRGRNDKDPTPEPIVNSMITKANMKKSSTNIVPDHVRKRGFRAIWEEALKKESGPPPASTYNRPKNVTVPAYPVPLAQPAQCLNKFAIKKLPLEEPRFRQINNQRNMIFHEEVFRKRFDGTKACSKVATRIFQQIFNQNKGNSNLFIMQLPNSLRTITNDNKNDLVDDDIKLKEQNLNIQKLESEETGAQKNEQPKILALQNFKHDQPFGKLQILKSGRVVLKIGNRRLDVVTTSPSQECDVGAIIEDQGAMQGNLQQGRFTLNQKPPSMNILGRVNQYFSAFYDYNKVLDESSLEDSVEETPKLMKDVVKEGEKMMPMRVKLEP